MLRTVNNVHFDELFFCYDSTTLIYCIFSLYYVLYKLVDNSCKRVSFCPLTFVPRLFCSRLFFLGVDLDCYWLVDGFLSQSKFGTWHMCSTSLLLGQNRWNQQVLSMACVTTCISTPLSRPKDQLRSLWPWS